MDIYMVHQLMQDQIVDHSMSKELEQSQEHSLLVGK